MTLSVFDIIETYKVDIYINLSTRFHLDISNHLSKIMDVSCVICKEVLSSAKTQTVGEKGHVSLISASMIRSDELQTVLQTRTSPFEVHVNCFKEYTRKTSLNSHLKRNFEPSADNGDDNREGVSTSLRSKSDEFDFETDCLFCGKTLLHDSKLPNLVDESLAMLRPLSMCRN